ncbi:MAG: sigma-54 interaction domain-containing protein [Bilophila wadsworthia]
MDISQRNLLELAMSSLPTGLFICDRDGIIRFINDAYANYLRVRPEDAMGRHITDFIPDSGIPAVIASGEPELGAWRSIQGSERKILVNRIPLRDQDGHVIGAFSLTLFDTPEQMQALLQRVDFLDKKVNSYARRIKSALRASHTINSILGNSPAITAFKSYLLRYARTESPVLILGATGTGKELAASAIHMASNRPDGPFVSINCAAIPKELFESEVFGYVPGAFSGAHKDGKIGQIELADQGTLFSTKWGSSCTHRSSCSGAGGENPLPARIVAAPGRGFRLVAATNRDLKKMIAAGTFREDLYYRINPMTLNLPPLSERVEDIPLIVRDVLNRMGGEGVRCTESAMNALMRYPWPGNIRELRNVLIRALSLCQDNQITLTDLPSELRQQAVAESAGTDGKLQSVVKNSEAQTIILALGDHHWNVAKTARALGISRASMYEKMRKFSIKRPPNGF